MDVLLVGIDAAGPWVLDPLIADGRLPTIAEVVDEGASGSLESQIPPWTASAWPSLYTGVNPGKHGVYGFLYYDGYDWDVVNASHVGARSLPELFDYHDRTSVAVNVPVTSPPPSVDGAVIPGYTAPEDPTCHPEGLLDDVRDAVGEYRVYPDRDREQPDEYVDLVGMRGRAFRHLAERYDPDFGFVQFQVTDTVFHEHGPDPEMVRAIYEAVDAQIGSIREACDPDTVVLASDHGMGPYEGHEFRVNEYLRREGFLETTNGGRGMPTWSLIREDRLRAGEASGDPDGPGLATKAVSVASKAGLTPARVGRALRAVGLDEYVASVVPGSLVNAGSEQVDFENSEAYVRSRIELGVRINLEGRDPDGVVPQSQYEAVRADLVETLSDVRTPDGDPVFETVAPREEFFDGPATDDAVDVVTVPAGFDHLVSADLKDEVFGDPVEPWNHKREGFVAVDGEDVTGGVPVFGASIFDVAPTVLAAAGLPPGEEMDGTVLPAVDDVDERSYPDYEQSTTVETDDAAVENRLADLGYLEDDS